MKMCIRDRAGTQEGIEQASKIQAGVLTLELFVGKNVTVVDVAEGEPAAVSYTHLPV